MTEDDNVRLVPAEQFAPPKLSFRTIISYAEEDCLRLHCVEEKLVPAQKPDKRLSWLKPNARRIVEDATTHAIIEGDRVLHLEFVQCLGWSNRFEGLFKDDFGLSKLEWPAAICIVEHSRWRHAHLDYWKSMRGEADELFHFRLLSCDAIYDILAGAPEGNWINKRDATTKHLCTPMIERQA